MNGLRLIRTIWDWYRDLGRANEPEQRSQRLLRQWLSADQRAQYEKYRYFEVVGSHTGRRYRIWHGTASNITELDNNGHPIFGWCFVPRDDLASGDVMLAQKIALETDEQGVLKIARNFAPRW
jgi:hypothetical protein